MKVGIVGVGYVGLVSGACFSDFGHHVVCLDKDDSKIQELNSGNIPIFEPGLYDVVKRNIDANRLKFSTDLALHIKEFDVIFVAVGTPARREDGNADMSSIFEVVNEIKDYISYDQLIVIKSTVPVGTNRIIYNMLNDRGDISKYNVASNPEFLREGSAIEDFMKPDRVVIGVRDERSKDIMMSVYKSLFLRDFPIVFTDPQSAETIKYASNAFLATKVSFINEISFFCEKVEADIKEVSKGLGLDKRIGNKFLHAGPGYGGSCFPKDTAALVSMGLENKAPLTIVEATINANQLTKKRMIDKIRKVYNGALYDKVITVLGITFKPNTDDVRDAPSLTIIPALQRDGAKIRAYDPQGKKEACKLISDIDWFEDAYSAAAGSDMILILTEWNEFRALNLKKISSLMKNSKLVDLRNIYSKKEALDCGFDLYVGIGR